MFDTFLASINAFINALIANKWHWVALAWGELILAYVGYLLYLRRRESILQQKKDNQ